MASIPRIRIREHDVGEVDLGDELSPLLKRIYRGRGIASREQLALNLSHLPAPEQLRGVNLAVDLLMAALASQQSLLIVGDFDADGATSTALALLALRAMGFQRVEFLVPNRFEYGYGLTPEIVALAARRRDQVPDLIITVDNGISSTQGVAAANAAGIGVIITDHHLPGRELPDAAAIVNPNQPGCTFPGKNLAGVGVIFYVLSALRARLRNAGWFAQSGIPEPNLATWLDLVALGTVADVVPLDSINRILVHQGLQRIRAGKARPGILALLKIAGRDHQRLVAADLGFAVGPRLNAAGRLDDMSVGIQCLLAEDADSALTLALGLDELNRDRRIIEDGMQREALAILAALDLDSDALPWGLCLFDNGWHPGVVGLLAGRIKDRLHRPVIVFAGSGKATTAATLAAPPTAEMKGSARSIPGFHIRDALDAIATRHPGLVDRFGGHAMAAGLSLQVDQFAVFAAAFDEEVRRCLSPADLAAEIWTDGELDPEAICLDVAQQIRQGGPWGQHFPEPLFYGEFRVVSHRVVGEKHLKLVLRVTAAGPSADQKNDPVVDAIAFNVVNEDWTGQLPEILPLAYRLDINAFRGVEAVQLLVERLLI
ncbi:MAG: single-stranded-DNA-specific exonuclease RecJ [Porticoccaceae bacterium]